MLIQTSKVVGAITPYNQSQLKKKRRRRRRWKAQSRRERLLKTSDIGWSFAALIQHSVSKEYLLMSFICMFRSDVLLYFRLLTPPSTPLFPSLEMESEKSMMSQLGTAKARPTTLRSRVRIYYNFSYSMIAERMHFL